MPAVRGSNFFVGQGEALGIVGESGSGKSATALAIMGLLPKSAKVGGQILLTENLRTTDLSSLPEAAFADVRGPRIGMIFQEPMSSLNPVLTCGEQVMEAILRHRPLSQATARQFALSFFEKVSLQLPSQIFSSYPHQLSGGQRQRVMIALALCSFPSLIIADEPTTALDVSTQQELLRLFRQLVVESGLSMLFISHDLAVVSQVCDRVLVMRRGEVVDEGLVPDIFTNPKHPYTRAHLACRPTLQQRAGRLPVVQDFLAGSSGEAGDISLPGKNKAASAFSEGKVGKQMPEGRGAIPDQVLQRPILSVRELSVEFSTGEIFSRKRIKAVQKVTFDLLPGEILGIVGESGSGKTTLGRAILNLIVANSGKVLYRNTLLTELTDRQWRRFRSGIQIVFQDALSSLNPMLTVGATLGEVLQHHHFQGDAQARCIELLGRVGLAGELLDRYPHQLSGGQRQRVCIARALAVEPEILICDESVSALDVSVQAQVLNLLLDLRDQLGLSILFISHDLSVVKFLSDRILVMQHGQVIETGTGEEIYHRPRKNYTRKLIESIPSLRDTDSPPGVE